MENTPCKRESSRMSAGTVNPACAVTVHVGSKVSLVHIGSLDSFDITEGGKESAGLILDYLESGKRISLLRAIDIYDHIIPNENFGGEYTALLWICKYLMTMEEERPHFFSHSLVTSWFDTLSKDNFSNLKEYLQRKYHFIENEKNDPEAKVKLRFLEDFILFNNPDRTRWDKTSENIRTLNLRKGDSVADVGCGPGYFTFKFADIVGESGHVYAIETNKRHLNYLKDYIRKYGINNVDVIESQPDGLGMEPSIKVDLVYMCSLYHIIYAACTDGERDLFIKSIKNSLKQDGRLVIVDNDLVEGDNLPYHGPYISRHLIIGQLWHYGFKLTAQYQFTPQRYVLEFKPSDRLPLESDAGHSRAVIFADPKTPDAINITSRSSLVRYRMIGTSSQGYTLLGKRAARLFYDALRKKDRDAAEAALTAYEELIPKERIGDEYTAFAWFCRILMSSEEECKEILGDKFSAEYYHHLACNDFALLKKYIRIKYDLAKPDPEEPGADDDFAAKRIHEVVYEYSGNEVSFDQLNDWNEYIVFNNPNRDSWEKTGKMLDYLNIQEGEAVADVGCGYGFFSFQFSRMVGISGRVYSLEVNKEALAYVRKISDKYGLNIQTVLARLNYACLPAGSVDTVFLCSLYHAVYIASIESVKDEFIASLKKALRKGGRLVIVDNAITHPPTIPYFGSGIAKELIIAQLKYYGFHLADARQFIPQRYILLFRQD
ncbi:MAG: methyltransferase domain-containing protein [bacterium]